MPINPNPRRTWLIIFAALVWTVFIYGLMAFLLDLSPSRQSPTGRPPDPTALRPIFYGLAVLALVASAGWLHFSTYGKIGGEGRKVELSPSEFQTNSIVALALAEACVILGLALFFLGAPLRELLIFGAGTLLVDLLVILPRGLAFWSYWERENL